MASKEKKDDKDWWDDEILTPLEETFDLSNRSYELATQAFEVLESANSDDLSEINECLSKIKKDGEQSKKILEEIKEKLDKKYPNREYDPREKKARRTSL